jgi:drug/metabolite transporter (DMT)-like permease
VGLVLCLVSAAGFGSLAIFGKQAYAGGLGVVGVLVLRFMVAAPLLVGLALVARRSLRVGWPTALRLLALGGIGYAIQATLFFNALARSSAGLAARRRCCTCIRPLPVQCALVSACWLVPFLDTARD